MDSSLPCSSVHGILQARILEWVAMPSSRGSFQPRDGTMSLMSPALAGRSFTNSATWEAHYILGVGVLNLRKQKFFLLKSLNIIDLFNSKAEEGNLRV